MNKFRGFFALLASAAILASFGIWIRYLDTSFGPFQQIAVRNIVVVLMSMAVIILLKRKITFKEIPRRYLFAYMFAFPFSIVFFTLSVIAGKIITAIFGLYLASFIISFVVGIVIFKEKVNFKKVLALILVFIALLVYTAPISFKNFLDAGFLFGICAGIAEAVANSFRKYLGGKLDKFVLVAVQSLGAFILGIILIIVAREFTFQAISTFNWGILIIFSSLLMLMYYLTLVGFSNFDLNLGTVVISSELFFGPLFAFAVFAESPTFFQIIGALLIMCAIVMLNVDLNSLKKSRNFF